MKDEILFRYFGNKATPDETRQIEKWLEADPANQKAFDAAHMLFNAMTLHQKRYAPAIKKANARPFAMQRMTRISLRVAAAVALLVGAVYTGHHVEQRALYRTLSQTMQTIEVPAGQRMSVTLSDGTEVCLNGGSRIEYPLLFAKNKRQVKLSGEALFKVTHNAKRPFDVETFASEIEVLGTQFNVYADAQKHRFSTTLVEGRVRVTNLLDASRQQIVMSPNEHVSMVGNRLVTQVLPNMDALCWTKGFIYIADIGFDELMERFENTYNVKIVVARKTLPKIGYVSGKIRVSEGVNFALKMLQQASDFTYTMDEATNTITIR